MPINDKVIERMVMKVGAGWQFVGGVAVLIGLIILTIELGFLAAFGALFLVWGASTVRFVDAVRVCSKELYQHIYGEEK